VARRGSCGTVRRSVRTKDGSYIRFDRNAVVLSDGRQPVGHGASFGPDGRESCGDRAVHEDSFLLPK